jgi:hypothetical protein
MAGRCAGRRLTKRAAPVVETRSRPLRLFLALPVRSVPPTFPTLFFPEAVVPEVNRPTPRSGLRCRATCAVGHRESLSCSAAPFRARVTSTGSLGPSAPSSSGTKSTRWRPAAASSSSCLLRGLHGQESRATGPASGRPSGAKTSAKRCLFLPRIGLPARSPLETTLSPETPRMAPRGGRPPC